MTTTTPNLEIVHIETSQFQKEVTANTAFDILDNALCGAYGLVLTSDANFDFGTMSSPGRQEALGSLSISISSSVPLTQTRTVEFPNTSKLYLLKNQTTGGQALAIATEGETPVMYLANGEMCFAYCDQTDFHKIGIAENSTAPAFFGTYSGGSLGTLTVSGTPTTLAGDAYYDQVTVPNAKTLATANFRLVVKGVLTVATGGVISCDGNAGASAVGGGAAGAALASGSLGGSNAAGGAGGTAAGTAGGNITVSSVFGTPGAGAGTGGGAGGAGGSGAGGAAGTRVPYLVTDGSINDPFTCRMGIWLGLSVSNMRVGAGGGGGGGNGSVGGGGGGAAGYMLICALVILNNGTIRALGGAGGAATANRGGGGGGQGGFIVLICQGYSGNGTVAVTGGAGGTGASGTGVNGSNGQAGLALTFILQF